MRDDSQRDALKGLLLNAIQMQLKRALCKPPNEQLYFKRLSSTTRKTTNHSSARELIKISIDRLPGRQHAPRALQLNGRMGGDELVERSISGCSSDVTERDAIGIKVASRERQTNVQK